MYAFQNHKLSIPAKLLYEDWGVISYDYYKKLCMRGKLVVTKQGRGAGNQAWVSFADLPVVKGVDLKAFCVQMLGAPHQKNIVVNHLEPLILPDPKAVEFFAQHVKPNGKHLKFAEQRQKATTAMILNAIETLFKDTVMAHKIFGKKKTHIWKNISQAVNNLNPEKWHFSLPNNPRSLQRRYNEYLQGRYASLIHKGEGSENARIVTPQMERLFIGLYCLPNKPYVATTYDMYLQFLGGGVQVYDYSTGEVFRREDFYTENGQLPEVSEATIWNYLNKPQNQLIISKYRNGDYDFSHKRRPHVNRHAPQYSMSKISLDDRDIMHTKLPDGSKVMAYYAYDVMSTAMIGIAHSKYKNKELFIDCLRNMFQFTTGYGLGIPLQMEVERHLVNDFSDGLMKAGEIFPFVRWCNPTNSQEKYAETGIRMKKYGVEKQNHQNVGRHYARLESNRITRQKIFDEFNDNYKESKASWEQIIAMELEEQTQYNNQLHPDQHRFAGKTRLQVFLENVNPNLPKLNKGLLAQFIGYHTHTTIVRSQYVRVQYQKYQLPSPQILTLLAPNNYQVDAYYIPQKDGQIKEVYLYQNGEFLCECHPVPTFNRANAEWTTQDVEKYQQAMRYIRQFDQMIKQQTQEKLPRLGFIQAPPTPIEVNYNTVEYSQEENLQEELSWTSQQKEELAHNQAILDL